MELSHNTDTIFTVPHHLLRLNPPLHQLFIPSGVSPPLGPDLGHVDSKFPLLAATVRRNAKISLNTLAGALFSFDY